MDRVFTDVTVTLDITNMTPQAYRGVIKALEGISIESLSFQSYNGDTLRDKLTEEQLKRLNEVRGGPQPFVNKRKGKS